MKTTRLPDTDSIEELARFWDHHDLTDFEDQLEESPETIFRRRPAVDVKIQLEPEEVEAVEQIAQTQGRDRAVLLHDWVVERLREVLRTQQPSEAK